MPELNDLHKFLFASLLLASLCILSGCTPALPGKTEIKPGTYSQTVPISFRGSYRDYRIHIPQAYDPSQKYPLLIAVHGAFSTAKEFETVSGLSDLADEEGFIVVYPNGVGILGFLQHWNGGHCCGMAAEKRIDDVGYLKAVIDDSKRRLPVDAEKIFMAGFSNGGMLTYRFASEYPEEIDAIAAISSAIGSTDNERGWEWQLSPPRFPVPVFIAHGVDDDSIPFAGGVYKNSRSTTAFYPVAQAVVFWTEANRCETAPAQSNSHNSFIQKETWEDSTGKPCVELYTIKGWDHRWPGRFYTETLPEGHALLSFNISQEIWNFFKTISDDVQ